MRIKALATAAFLASTASFAGTAQAITIDQADFGACVGLAACVVDGTLLSAIGGVFETKTLNGATGLGVSTSTAGEIDIDEAITAAFQAGAQLVTNIQFLFLYNGPEFNDPQEIARVTAQFSPTSSTAYLLIAQATDNSALWTPTPATTTVTSCGTTTASGTGCFNVGNPFGNQTVTGLRFEAVNSGGPHHPNNSDYSIGNIKTVPEPATLGLLGAGLLGLGAALRRGRKQTAAA